MSKKFTGMRINTKSSDQTAEAILSILSSQKFAKWYMNGHFDHYMSEDQKIKPQIIKDIKEMFHINQ
jgi:hypothetical protein